MKHILYRIIPLALLLSSALSFGQKKDPRWELTQPIEKEIDNYIKDNIDAFELSPKELNNLNNESEHDNLSKAQLDNYILKIKNARLRSLYFKLNPENIKPYLAKNINQQNRQTCIDGNFEGINPLANYNFSNYNETQSAFDACNMTLQTGTPAQIPDSIDDPTTDYTLVSQGLDPIIPQVSRTFDNTNRAIKLNRNSGGRDVTYMTRTFNSINENNLSLNFSLILQQPGHLIPQPDGSIKNEQPFFRIRLYDSNNIVFYERCIISDPNDCIFTQTGGTLYSDWRCLNINTESLLGQSATLEFSIIDCGQGGHYGTVYIDEICNTTCLNSDFGDVTLDPVNLNCPENTFQVCGSYLSPLCTTNLQNINLDIFDQFGNNINTLTNPVIDLTNNQFCFNVNPSDFGSNPSGNYEFEAVANFNTTTGFVNIINDLSANIGADVAFNNCPNPCDTVTESIINGTILSWTSTANSFELEFASDANCCPNGGEDIDPPVNISYTVINSNSINLSSVYADMIAISPMKCFRYKIKTDCSEWSDWCCVVTMPNNTFGNPYNECFPSSPCDNLSPLTLTSPDNDINVNSGNVNYINNVNITASNKIEQNYTSEYRASDFIRLTDGFHAKSGSLFLAGIEECIDIDIVPPPSNKKHLNEDEFNLKVLPNPAKDLITLSIKEQKIKSYILYDLHGKIINLNKNVKNYNHNINVNNLARGFYILKITLEDNSIHNKNIILN